SDEPQDTQEQEQEPTPTAAPPDQHSRLAAMPALPQIAAAERVRLAARQRAESDYIFSYWSALGWTILTFGIYGYYVFYQLVRGCGITTHVGSNSSMRRPPRRGSR